MTPQAEVRFIDDVLADEIISRWEPLESKAEALKRHKRLLKSVRVAVHHHYRVEVDDPRAARTGVGEPRMEDVELPRATDEHVHANPRSLDGVVDGPTGAVRRCGL